MCAWISSGTTLSRRSSRYTSIVPVEEVGVCGSAVVADYPVAVLDAQLGSDAVLAVLAILAVLSVRAVLSILSVFAGHGDFIARIVSEPACIAVYGQSPVIDAVGFGDSYDGCAASRRSAGSDFVA